MEGFDFDDHNAMEKSSSIINCGFRQIKKVFRVMEIFIVLVFLTWTFNRLPYAGEYLRQVVKFVHGHLFVFFLTNIIVLILFFTSRNLFLQHNAEIPDISGGGGGGGGGHQPEEVVYQDKETILEVTKVRVHRRSQSENFRRKGSAKELRRSETERRRRVVEEQSNEEFQRSIEEFIAKQVKFHQEEKLAIVCN